MDGERQSKPWRAVVLSLLTAGLGHVYAGKPLRALLIAMAVQGLAVLAALLAATGSARAVWLALATAPLVMVLVAIDAARIASHPRARFLTRRAIVLACGGFLVVAFGLGFGGDWARQCWGAKPFRMPSGSMFPTLLIGDHFYADVGTFGRRDPQRGEVVVFEVARDGVKTFAADLRPDLPRELHVNRIVGLPGDRIAMRAGAITLNGELVETRPLEVTFLDDLGRPLEVYEQRVDSRAWKILDDPAAVPPDGAPITVPEGRYYVLGDNRDHSKDSRYWGTVARNDLLGPVTQIYWSWDFNGTWVDLLSPWVWWDLLSTKTRWDRIGLTTE